MSGVEANRCVGLLVLARYPIDDDADAQTQRQRLAARRLIESEQPLMVSKSAILELSGSRQG